MVILQSDLRLGSLRLLNQVRSDLISNPPRPSSVRVSQSRVAYTGMQATQKQNVNAKEDKTKPKICTADELHYVDVSSCGWRLALWRYLPPSKSPRRKHPLLLLSGVGTNAIGYDLSPESSFARFMSGQGYDTWILEVRGAGLSTHGVDFGEVKQPLNSLLEAAKNSPIANQIRDLTQRLVNIFKEGQWWVTPQLFDLQERFSTSIGDFQEQLDLIIKYDWDFDHYLEEDVPAVVRWST